MTPDLALGILGGAIVIVWVGIAVVVAVRRRHHERAVLADEQRRSRVLKAVAAAEYRERTKESRMH